MQTIHTVDGAIIELAEGVDVLDLFEYAVGDPGRTMTVADVEGNTHVIARDHVVRITEEG